MDVHRQEQLRELIAATLAAVGPMTGSLHKLTELLHQVDDSLAAGYPNSDLVIAAANEIQSRLALPPLVVERGAVATTDGLKEVRSNLQTLWNEFVELSRPTNEPEHRPTSGSAS